ncbi:VC0807 family protein [Psychrobacillus sp. L4]|uniref:VC0807 family protein n=1 Tax=Psychrobacillus sp. L4 TaxID=3236892 RepID=UPI0036F2A81C
MKINFILLELIVYLGLPYVIWTHGRGFIGDYYAMLLSTIPAIIYTIYRFMKNRQFNRVGVFIIASLMLSSILDLLAGSAIQMLWNSVWLSYAFTSIYIFSMIIQKPLAAYFAIEFMYIQGYQRENSKKLYFMKENLKWFQLVTLLFVIKGVVMNTNMFWLIRNHGAEAYMHLIIVRRIMSYAFSGLIFLAFLFAGNKAIQLMNKYEKQWSKPVEYK